MVTVWCHAAPIRCADELGIRERTLFGTKVTEVAFDDSAAVWHVATDRGDSFTADFVVLGQCVHLYCTMYEREHD